jgi:hypothetical protein
MSGPGDESLGAEGSSRVNAAHALLALFDTPDAMQRWLGENFYVEGEWDGGDVRSSISPEVGAPFSSADLGSPVRR